MLSQVKKRLLHQSFMCSNIMGNPFIIAPAVRFSSKKNDKWDDKSFPHAGVSEPAKSLLRAAPKHVVNKLKKLSENRGKLADIHVVKPEGDLFDQIVRSTSNPVAFKNSRLKKEVKNKAAKKQPSKLNARELKNELIDAAINVAVYAGKDQNQVLNEMYAKLNEDIGMEKHTPKRMKRAAKADRDNEAAFNIIKEFPEELDSAFMLRKTQRNRTENTNTERNENIGMKKHTPKQTKRAAKAGYEEIPKELDSNFMRRKTQRNRTKDTNTDELGGIISSVIDTATTLYKRRQISFSSVEQLLQSQAPLGIFSPNMEVKSGYSLKMWHAFEMAEVRRETRFEPLHWFDQCIQWTEDGKLWHFPINNEQGMDEEAKVDFTEHIFLDHHIESWCPQDGPIRNFMELVLVGLSKNPYYTVQEKIETIEWYHKYFTKHRDLLEEINAFGSANNPIPVEGKLS